MPSKKFYHSKLYVETKPVTTNRHQQRHATPKSIDKRRKRLETLAVGRPALQVVDRTTEVPKALGGDASEAAAATPVRRMKWADLFSGQPNNNQIHQDHKSPSLPPLSSSFTTSSSSAPVSFVPSSPFQHPQPPTTPLSFAPSPSNPTFASIAAKWAENRANNQEENVPLFDRVQSPLVASTSPFRNGLRVAIPKGMAPFSPESPTTEGAPCTPALSATMGALAMGSPRDDIMRATPCQEPKRTLDFGGSPCSPISLARSVSGPASRSRIGSRSITRSRSGSRTASRSHSRNTSRTASRNRSRNGSPSPTTKSRANSRTASRPSTPRQQETSLMSDAERDAHTIRSDCEDKEDDDEGDVEFEQEDEAQVFFLSSIEELAREVPDGAMVVFDIDETLVMTRFVPCELLSTNGVRVFQKHVNHLPMDFHQKNEYCKILQEKLKDKVTVEERTTMVVRDLQSRGCAVFGLTARYVEMSSMTERCLYALGINMCLTAPFNTEHLTDQETEAVLHRGVIYCNNEDKGIVLNRFLRDVVFAPALNGDACQLPAEIVFVDDQYHHAESVSRELSVAAELGIPVTSYHYQPPVLADEGLFPDEEDSENKAKLREKQKERVLQFQIDAFLDTGAILTNRDASQALKEMRKSASAAVLQSPLLSPFQHAAGALAAARAIASPHLSPQQAAEATQAAIEAASPLMQGHRMPPAFGGWHGHLKDGLPPLSLDGSFGD